ncbi:histidine phosphatase family protein [Devriesea agamarum]|uniref:histidine phosphatase family protein n=1 Tax=Devriesea agamarum TaxID=472569 RepID=UPI00071DB8DA|nr:histidine phosphatase family protein [Devriesea agamarum]
MTLFGLVRHGQTDYNANNLFQGSSDIPLNTAGIAQAHRALEQVPDLSWDIVVSSPLSRAEQTARIIADDHSIPFTGTDPRLREIDWGLAEGQPVSTMLATYPNRNFPGVEDSQAVADRGFEALSELASRFPDSKVLVVAHGTLIRFLISGIIGHGLPSLPNCALSQIAVNDRTWSVTMIAGTPWNHTVCIPAEADSVRFTILPSFIHPANSMPSPPVTSD